LPGRTLLLLLVLVILLTEWNTDSGGKRARLRVIMKRGFARDDENWGRI
jgi:hypothetical protein